MCGVGRGWRASGAFGDAREPHLHFEVTTSSKLLAGEGVPYLIDRYSSKTTSDGHAELHIHQSCCQIKASSYSGNSSVNDADATNALATVGFVSHYGQAGSNLGQKANCPKSRHSQSTCLCSRLTGQLVFRRFHISGNGVSQALEFSSSSGKPEIGSEATTIAGRT